MEKKLRIGMVGLGGMGGHHFNCHLRNPRVEIVALCDIIKERATHPIEEHHLNAKAYTDFK